MAPTLPPSAYRTLGRTGMRCTWIGFGTYRIDEQFPEHREALTAALEGGCNLIDTSTNYMDGGAESCVGGLLRQRGQGDVTLVSKVGYVQGGNLEMARGREEGGDPFPDMVKISQDCWHCIHPFFIESQLGSSLERLQGARLGVYLLHNPEYFFSDALARGEAGDLSNLRREFYRRIREAFIHLEREVADGRIQHYGVSSNTLGSRPEDAEFTDLKEMWEIARSVAGSQHHFSVVQMPANLLETGPFLHGAIAAAAERGLGVLLNRPLNAIKNQHLYRLADFPAPPTEKLPHLLEVVCVLEEEFTETLGKSLSFRKPSLNARDLFRWGLDLTPEHTERFSPDEWAYLEARVILPQTHECLRALGPAMEGPVQERWQDWQRRYLRALGNLLAAVRGQSQGKSRELGHRLSEQWKSRLPTEWRDQSLSRKALGIVGHYPGVSCVLNGMRKTSYVEDSLGALALPPLNVEKSWFSENSA